MAVQLGLGHVILPQVGLQLAGVEKLLRAGRAGVVARLVFRVKALPVFPQFLTVHSLPAFIANDLDAFLDVFCPRALALMIVQVCFSQKLFVALARVSFHAFHAQMFLNFLRRRKRAVRLDLDAGHVVDFDFSDFEAAKGAFVGFLVFDLHVISRLLDVDEKLTILARPVIHVPSGAQRMIHAGVLQKPIFGCECLWAVTALETVDVVFLDHVSSGFYWGQIHIRV